MESAGGTLMAALAGVNMISGAGMMDFESCQSLEKLVLDAEMIGMAKRLVRGIEPRDEPIALTLFQKMGHRAEYLAEPHTLKWFAKELYLPSPVIDRATYDGWKRKGATTAAQRAAERVRTLVAAYEPSPVSAELARGVARDRDVGRRRSSAWPSLPPLPDCDRPRESFRGAAVRVRICNRPRSGRHHGGVQLMSTELLAQITASLVAGDPDAVVDGTRKALAGRPRAARHHRRRPRARHAHRRRQVLDRRILPART